MTQLRKLKGKKDNSCVLIESTANQCDQYGGYTGMKPADFKAFVEDIAKEIGNAVPVKLGKIIGESILNFYKK